MYKIAFINNGCVIFLTLSAIKRAHNRKFYFTHHEKTQTPNP